MAAPDYWLGKPYYSLDAYCKKTFHAKCSKIALDAHMTCPNRDGTLDTRGCLFCSRGGSGEFAVSVSGRTVSEQLALGVSMFSGKKVGDRYIAYFQAYTNTYAPVEYLESIFTQALSHPAVIGISIATRPDCLPDAVLSLLARLKQSFCRKFIWIELGLQTIHERSARLIRRGYPLSCFEASFEKLRALDIPVIVHVILGLPEESAADMYETVRYLSRLRPFGVKLQLLHVLKGTDLAALYCNGKFQTLSQEKYLEILIRCLELLDPGIEVHRVTGDGPGHLMIAPLWSRNKRAVLNGLHRLMRERNTWQGRLWEKDAANPAGRGEISEI